VAPQRIAEKLVLAKDVAKIPVARGRGGRFVTALGQEGDVGDDGPPILPGYR